MDGSLVHPLWIENTLAGHLFQVKTLHEEDLRQDLGAVYLLDALARTYPLTEHASGWELFFRPCSNQAGGRSLLDS